MTLGEFLSGFHEFLGHVHAQVGTSMSADGEVALFRLWLDVQTGDEHAATAKQVRTLAMLVREGHVDWRDAYPFEALTKADASRLIEVGFKRREGLGFRGAESRGHNVFPCSEEGCANVTTKEGAEGWWWEVGESQAWCPMHAVFAGMRGTGSGQFIRLEEFLRD